MKWWTIFCVTCLLLAQIDLSSCRGGGGGRGGGRGRGRGRSGGRRSGNKGYYYGYVPVKSQTGIRSKVSANRPAKSHISNSVQGQHGNYRHHSTYYTHNKLFPVRNPSGYGPPPPYRPITIGPRPARKRRPLLTYTRTILNPPPLFTIFAYSPIYRTGNYGIPYQSGYRSVSRKYLGVGVATTENNNTYHHRRYYPYTTNDTGDDTLGSFLGYSLGTLISPSYDLYNSYDYGVPRYDHYTVHHYYHNNKDVPKEAIIEPQTIVHCYGDSTSICPSGTLSLCTTNGAVICVASVLSTVPCSNEIQTKCVRSIVPCTKKFESECENLYNVTIKIPCISTAKVYANIIYVNSNVVVVSNYTENSNKFMSTSIATGKAINGKKGHEFCVTILALPAKRKPMKGQTFFDYSKNIFSKFAVRALGVDDLI